MNNRPTRRSLLRNAGLFATGAALHSIAPRLAHAAVQTPATAAAVPSGNLVEKFRAAGSKTPIRVTPLAANLFLLQGVGGNMTLLVGPDGKLLVDASVSTAAPRVKQAMDSLGPQPLVQLVNTHWHFDHTDGNAAMHGYGATILAQENTRKRLSTPQEVAALHLHFAPMPAAALPQQTFVDSMQLYWNRETLDLAHFQPAHTDSDISVHYRNANVLHTGDIWFNGFYPLIDYSTGGNIDGMIAGAAQCIGLADSSTKIVPGHGPLGDRAGLVEYHGMLTTVRERVARLKRGGRTLEEAVAAKPTKDLDARWGGGNFNGDAFVGLVYRTLNV
jgi:cyclase